MCTLRQGGGIPLAETNWLLIFPSSRNNSTVVFDNVIKGRLFVRWTLLMTCVNKGWQIYQFIRGSKKGLEESLRAGIIPDEKSYFFTGYERFLNQSTGFDSLTVFISFSSHDELFCWKKYFQNTMFSVRHCGWFQRWNVSTFSKKVNSYGPIWAVQNVKDRYHPIPNPLTINCSIWN